MMNDNDGDELLPISGDDSMDGMASRRGLGHEQGPGDMFVDRIEGDRAILLKKGPNGTETQEVPVSALPHGTKEGDIIPSGGGKQSMYSPAPGESDQDMESMINSIYAMPR